MQIARRSKKGRAIESMIMEIRKNLEKADEEEKEVEGIMIGRIRCGKNSGRIVGVYVNGGIEKNLEKKREIRKIVGGDFNVRTETERG